MKKVHLVLGSGGARGMAHIGVIENLLQDGYEIVEVIGCSMGAVVGAMYCAGYLNEYKNWLLGLTKTSVFSLFDLTFTMQGFVKGERIFNKLQELTGDRNIEDLLMPFTAVATDMVHKQEKYFTTGNLYKALRASIAIPGVFTPVVHESSVLVDGGVLNPLPVNLVHKIDNAILVAVNLNGPAMVEVDKQDLKETDSNNYWDWLSKFSINSRKDMAEDQKINIPRLSLFDLINTSFDFTQDRLTELMIHYHQPDLIIEIPRNSCSTFEFYRAKELIETGKNAYNRAKLLNTKE